MLLSRFAGDLLQANPADARRRPCEIFVHQLLTQADRFKDLRAAIGFDGGNPHLGHDLDHALDCRFDVTFNRVIISYVFEQALADHVIEALEGKIGIDRLHTVADQQAKVVYLARLAGFEHQPHPRARAAADEMMVQPGRGQQGRNRRIGAIEALV